MVRVPMFAALLLGYGLTATASEPPDAALWNADRTAAVTAIPGESGTRVTAFLRQRDGTFLEVDLSTVESGNFGKLGRHMSDYDHFETQPIEWLPRQDDLLQVKIQTQAWRAGQRYTVSEPLVFSREGKVLGR